MTNLAQRAERVLALAKATDPHMSGWESYDCFLGTSPSNRAFIAAAHEAADLVRALFAENERLAARVLELECGKERARKLREAGFVPRPPMPSDE